MTRTRNMHKLTRRHWLKVAGYAAATLLFGQGCRSSVTTSQPAIGTAEGGPEALPTVAPQVSSMATAQPPSQVSTPGSGTPEADVVGTHTASADPTLPTQNTSTVSAPPPVTTSTSPLPSTVATPQSESLERRLGQMLLVGFRGLDIGPDHVIARDIRDYNLGGVLLFDFDVPTNNPVRNIESPQQVQQLVATLQSMASTPLLVAIDQEGGQVARLRPKHGFKPTVSQQSLGASGDPGQTQRQASEIAIELAGLGINFNLAPVVDLNINPNNPIIGQLERSYGATSATVVQHAIECIKAHHAQGILCALKHFPGHGSSKGDTHLGVVDVTQTWSRIELEPFDAIIKAGLADTIMMAHVFNARLDQNYPASLSSSTIMNVLRGELGYDGVVCCDDLQMSAIRAQFGFEEALRHAIEAGNDIITFANNSVWDEGITGRAVGVIHRLVQQGTLSEARINESYQRILRFKRQLRTVV